jgi:multiple sugar transport system substrate-binding protein
MPGRGRRITRRWLRLGLAAALLATMAACSADSAEPDADATGPVTLRLVWWGDGDVAKATQAAVELFRSKNPDITVQTEVSTYDAYFQKLSSEAGGAGVPDVVQLDRAHLGDLAGRNALKDLSPYTGNALRTSDIADGLLGSGKIKGKLYAVPGAEQTQALVYDPAVWQAAGVPAPRPGWTSADFTGAMAQLGTKGVPGATDYGGAIDEFEVWLLAHGKQMYTDDGELGFTQKDLADFWKTLAALRTVKGVTPAEVTTKADGTIATSAFITKSSASEVTDTSRLRSYLTSYGKPIKVVALPAIDGRTGMSSLPSVVWGVGAKSAHADAAVKLVDFLVNDPAAGALLGVSRGLPANTTVRAQVAAKATGNDKLVVDYAAGVKSSITATPSAWPAGAAAIQQEFGRVYSDLLRGEITVNAAAQQIIESASKSLGGG